LRGVEDSAPLWAARVPEAVAWGLREYAAALAEREQLREALTSRATIDQAKGILMAEHHCSPDEAFALLVRLSNDTNVRLADVASALVYQTARDGSSS
jgi:AmiR/NasT family two-component response regulator